MLSTAYTLCLCACIVCAGIQALLYNTRYWSEGPQGPCTLGYKSCLLSHVIGLVPEV
jgi:hypothetical protein